MKRNHSLWSRVALSWALSACSAPAVPDAEFTLELRGVNEEGAPLAGVSFSLGKPIGVTNAEGRLRHRLAAPESTTVDVVAACPNDYKEAPRIAPVRLTKTRRIDDSRAQSIPVEVRCERRLSDVLVVVRAERGARLPVVVDGKPLTTTDDDGIAHVLLRRSRSSGAVDVALDTSARPELKPLSPSRTYQLAGADAVVLFEQAFVTQAAPLARAVAPRRHIPVRVD